MIPTGTFIRAQISSLVSTLVDFSITILLSEAAGWWYLSGTAAGTFAGGITNFELGRHWVFRAAKLSPVKQARRYILVWLASLFLNVGFVYLLTSQGHLHYIISKVIVSCLISISFNFVLQWKFVYRRD